MVLIGGTNIGFDDENNLVYLGNKRNSGTELIHENANEVFFDNKNVPNITNITLNYNCGVIIGVTENTVPSCSSNVEYNNNVKLIECTDNVNSTNFINGAKFYTCRKDGQNGLCFRCYNNCVSCVTCNSCDSCFNCTNCTNGCVSECNTKCYSECQNCNACTSCLMCNKLATS